MHMRGVVVARGGRLAGLIGSGGRRGGCMIIAMLVAVVPEVGAVVLRMLQRIAYAHDRRMGGVQ